MVAFVAAVTAIALGPVAQAREAHMAGKAAKTQMNMAENRAAADAAAAERAFNAANRKRPNIIGMMASNRMQPGGGTMLTGPTGVDPGRLSIGKTSLLGG